MNIGYRYFDKENKDPLFPFGFGLSYAEYAIKMKLKLLIPRPHGVLST